MLLVTSKANKAQSFKLHVYSITFPMLLLCVANINTIPKFTTVKPLHIICRMYVSSNLLLKIAFDCKLGIQLDYWYHLLQLVNRFSSFLLVTVHCLTLLTLLDWVVLIL